MESLKDKVVVITGAGSGMGREMSLLCTGRGAIVAMADYNKPSLLETEKMVKEKKGRCSVHVADISNLKSVKTFAKEVIAKHKKVDVLINNAGIIPKFERFEASNYGVFERMFAVNIWGVIYCTGEFMPYLKKQKEAALVNTSSAAGIVGYMGLSSYVASKFAVRGFSEALRMENMGTGLTVTVVHPGAIKTNISKNNPFLTEKEKKEAEAKQKSAEASFPGTEASDAARIIIDGMMKKKVRILVGRDAKIQDYMARLMPVGYTKMLYDKMKELLK